MRKNNMSLLGLNITFKFYYTKFKESFKDNEANIFVIEL